MSASETIIDLYLHHANAFSKHLESSSKLGKKEVHKLRVDIKNIRVLFGFLESLPHKKFNSTAILKILKPVFKRAGEIRSQHLNLSLTNGYRSAMMRRFNYYLKAKEIKAGKAFVKEIRRFDPKAFKKLHQKNLKVLKNLVPDFVSKKCETYTRHTLAKLHEDMFELNDDAALHRVRKHLKSLRSMNHLLSKINASPAIRFEVKKLDSIYETLGDWHDGLMFAETFEKFVLKHEGPDAGDEATTLLLKMIEKNEKNKTLILKRLKLDLV